MLDMIRKRRSIRKYRQTPIEREKVEQLIQAVLMAPTSRNTRSWEFLIIDDRTVLEKLSFVKVGAQFLQGAALGIVVLADPEKSDVWIEDTSIATLLLQLTAQSLGLGSCWIQIRERQHKDGISSETYVRDILGIPVTLKVESIVSLGYPDETKPPHAVEKLQYEKIHRNGFGKHFYPEGR